MAQPFRCHLPFKNSCKPKLTFTSVFLSDISLTLPSNLYYKKKTKYLIISVDTSQRQVADTRTFISLYESDRFHSKYVVQWHLIRCKFDLGFTKEKQSFVLAEEFIPCTFGICLQIYNRYQLDKDKT